MGWPGLTNVGGGTSLVKFVVGYCGTVAIHTRVNAAEWNTVIEGEGEVAYWGVNNGMVRMQVKKGDTFVFPQGAAHYWVNYSPNTQLVTVGGFTGRAFNIMYRCTDAAVRFPQLCRMIVGLLCSESNMRLHLHRFCAMAATWCALQAPRGSPKECRAGKYDLQK